jgi:lipopolysaccharide heptosyltransferase II
MFYSHRISCKDPDMHAVDRNYLFGRRLGFEQVPITFELPVRPQARESVQGMLEQAGIAPNQPYVLMAPGTRWETKLWPADYFAAIARWILEQHRLPIVLIGAGDEVDIARHVHEQTGGRTVNLAGQTALPEVIALVADTVLAVMHDSGPMHLATALNKPMVAIFGPTSPQRTGPYRHPEAVTRLDLSCSPCYLKKVADCPYNHRCMKDLSPDLIRARISELLTGGETAQ